MVVQAACFYIAKPIPAIKIIFIKSRNITYSCNTSKIATNKVFKKSMDIYLKDNNKGDRNIINDVLLSGITG